MMATPSVILSTLKNEDTGIDISVPRFQEEEAPLGGISILYEISVLTNLELFKNRLHKTEDIVHFSLYKAYREFEEFHNKLNKKFPKSSLPPILISNSKEEEKVTSLNCFMNAVAKNSEICSSQIFTQFIGVNLNKSSNLKMSTVSPCEANITTESIDAKNSEIKENKFSLNIESPSKEKDEMAKKSVPKIPKNIDLFEEVKLSNENLSSESSKKNLSSSLFDDLEDESLFTMPSKKAEPIKVEKKIIEPKKPEPQKPIKTKLFDEKPDDSELIIKNRKPGEVSLFSDQDLGEYITKEEEPLFLVTAPSNKKKSNLAKENEILSPESDKGVNDNLDDLLNFEPLPSLAKTEESKTTTSNVTDSIAKVPNDGPAVPTKPVPLPRKKSLGKIDMESVQKPQVMPRKVFLNKTESTEKTDRKPTVPSKPSKPPPPVRAKPVLPPKPKPASKKPSDSKIGAVNLDSTNANKVEGSESSKSSNTVMNDLGQLDILKYIEQESMSIDSKLDLFDCD